jgi:hypothetical protein
MIEKVYHHRISKPRITMEPQSPLFAAGNPESQFSPTALRGGELVPFLPSIVNALRPTTVDIGC